MFHKIRTVCASGPFKKAQPGSIASQVLVFLGLLFLIIGFTGETGRAQTSDSVIAEFHLTTSLHHSKLFPGVAYPQVDRPAVGLALSGGGLKGIAHIGVLKGLAEADIPIDYITGTSSGSIVGGLYALGYSVEEIDSIAHTIDYETIFIDQPQRKNLFVSQKAQANKYLVDVRFDQLKPYIPISLTTGQAIGEQLTNLFLHSPYSTIRDFNYLQVPFRAVSTELETGERHVIQEGDWIEAVRASSSIPMVLSPVPKDGIKLIDGGVSDNIPIDLAKDIGADFVIAIDVRAKLYRPEELQNLLLVADQVINILINSSRQEVIENADVIVTPDFNEQLPETEAVVDQSIHRGYTATKNSITEIRRKYHQLLERPNTTYSVDTVSVTGNSVLTDGNIKEIARISDLQYPAPMSSASIDSTLKYLLHSGYFADVSGEVKLIDRQNVLQISLRENPTVITTTITGVHLLDVTNVARLIQVMEDIPYNPRMLQYFLKDIISKYRGRGYGLAKVDTVQWNPTSGALAIQFSEGRLGDIRYEGNALTEEYVLAREILLKRGDYITSPKVQQTITNLYSTELFDYVSVEFSPLDEPGLWEMHVRVQEKKYQAFKFGFRIDNQRGDAGIFSLEHQNFQGTGSQFTLETKIGLRDRFLHFNYGANRFFKTYITFEFSLGHNWSQYQIFDASQTNQSPNYTIQRNIASFSLGHQIARLGLVNAIGKYQGVHIRGPANRELFNARYNLATLTLQSIVDTKDQADFPQSGNYQRILYEIASENFGSDIGYTKFAFDSDWYLTFIRRHTFHAGIQVKLGDETLPFSEWFYLGGLDSFMGLNEYEAFGTKSYVGNFEYRYRIPVSSLFNMYLFLKYDIAAITDDVLYNISRKDFFNGQGFGVGASTPAGPLRLAYGRNSLGDDAFYFYLGWEF